MNRMVVRYGRIGVLLAALAMGGLTACSENLESGTVCTATTELCPQPLPTLRDTTLYPVVLDTTIGSFPPIGQETSLTLAARGDSLDTRVILRYDSLPTTYRVTNATADSAIRAVKGAVLVLRFDPTLMHPASPTAPVRIDLFDVYAPGVDTVASQLLALFTPDRFLASRVIPPDSLIDSVLVPLPDDSIAAHITSNTPLRIGIRVSSSESIQLAVRPYTGAYGNPIRFTPVSPDTAQAKMEAQQVSTEPADLPFLMNNLIDFMIVARAPLLASNAVLETGGVPARRAYFRFNLPSAVVDSTTVVRATLQLVQRPNAASPAAYEQVTVRLVPVLASADVTDLYRATQITGSIAADSAIVAPADSGARAFELVHLVNSWAGKKEDKTPRAIVLESSGEGTSAGIIQFFSSTADPTVRPRLRLTYVPRSGFGLP